MDQVSKFNNLLQPITLGDIQLPNRVALAALTRRRCGPDNVPTDLHVKYYTQRANAAFMLTECSPISLRGNAFPGAGGIYTQEQEDGWRRVVDSVHKAGGKIHMQIWHAGRASHSALQNGLEIWSSCAIAIRQKNSTTRTQAEIPHEMTLDEINLVIEQFRQGAVRAKNARFDGIQLHGAHGYLIDQFLRNSCNKRTDNYGGSIENRCRLALEVIDALIGVFGAKKVGIKVSPVGCFNDMNDSNPVELYTYLLQRLDYRRIAYVELKDDHDKENNEGYGYPASSVQIPDIFSLFRPYFSGVIIGNNEFTSEKAEQYIKKGICDMVTFGRPYIINPDLVPRLKAGIPLDTVYNFETFYSSGGVGYSDYLTYGLNINIKQKQNLRLQFVFNFHYQ